MTSIAALVVGGSPDPWEALGFAKLSSEGARTSFSLADVELVVDASLAAGSVDWCLADSAFHGPAGNIGCLGVDHVVWRTNDLDATCEEITRLTGAPRKRVRDAGGGVLQGFHRVDNVVVEVVVGGTDIAAPHMWGFVVNVADLDAVCAFAGPDVIGAVRVDGRSVVVVGLAVQVSPTFVA
ncbi:MAG: hypothetical protein EBU67_01395 [Actinobacteria bacterium]|nr:hypothetical protein [Actinomycetota bacterium]